MAQWDASARQHELRIHLLGGPWVTIDAVIHEIPDGSKRLLAFLALDRRHLDRRYVAGSLWPDSDDDRAGACLRTALWRLRQAGLDVIELSRMTLRLLPEITVDAEDAAIWARRILEGDPCGDGVDVIWGKAAALDLLPGWYDDWVMRHREVLRQLLLHALDALSRRLSVDERHAEAVLTAQLAVAADPLRESAQEALLRAHLAEGNKVEARRALTRYEALLFNELAASPNATLYRLIGLAGGSSPASRDACVTCGSHAEAHP